VNGLFQTDIDPTTGLRVPTTKSTMTVPRGMPGGVLSLSANGTAAGSGIVWATAPYSADAHLQTVAGIFRAFDASDLSIELWNSKQNAARDDAGDFAKFTPPTIANGKVYLATFSNQLVVYGLLGSPPAPAPAVSGVSPSSGPSSGGTVLTISGANFDYAEDIATGPNAVTVTDTVSGGTLWFAVFEYSGVAAASSLDVTAAARGMSTTADSGAATTTASGDLVIGAISTAESATFTPGPSYVINELLPTDDTKLMVEERRQAVGTVSAERVAHLGSGDGGIQADAVRLEEQYSNLGRPYRQPREAWLRYVTEIDTAEL
jgi:hypothetical protein